VWEFLRQQRGQIWVEFLPGYAPELNPVGYLWVSLEAARAAQLLPGDVGSVEHSRSPGAAADASPADSGLRFLGTGRAVPVVFSRLIASSWKTKVPFAQPCGEVGDVSTNFTQCLAWCCC
jgi:hypothetical protein